MRTLKNKELSLAEKSALVQTLDAWFRPGQSISLSQELPLIFGNSEALHVFLEDEEGVLGHAATLPTEVDVKDQRYPLTLISSVGIRPNRRGQGWGAQLIQACEAVAEPPFLLWSDKTAFYTKLGFEPFGLDKLVILELKSQRKNGTMQIGEDDLNRRIREANESDIPGLELLLAGNPSFCPRTREQWSACLRIPRARVFVLMSQEQGGRPLAFAAMGKGLDFPETLHDLGGSPRDLSLLLSQLPQFLGRDIACLLPNADLFGLLPIAHVEERPFALAKGGGSLPENLYFGGFSSV